MPRTPPRRTSPTGPTVGGGTPPSAALSKDSQLAGEIKALVMAGDRDAARERFADLVAHQQRRAVRIAYHYLRDAHDADEAVQDAFVKVFHHIGSYREELPFEVWFTRILVNGCLDLRKARGRRLRWTVSLSPPGDTLPLDPATPETGGDTLLTRSVEPPPAPAQNPPRIGNLFQIQSAVQIILTITLHNEYARLCAVFPPIRKNSYWPPMCRNFLRAKRVWERV